MDRPQHLCAHWSLPVTTYERFGCMMRHAAICRFRFQAAHGGWSTATAYRCLVARYEQRVRCVGVPRHQPRHVHIHQDVPCTAAPVAPGCQQRQLRGLVPAGPQKANTDTLLHAIRNPIVKPGAGPVCGYWRCRCALKVRRCYKALTCPCRCPVQARAR